MGEANLESRQSRATYEKREFFTANELNLRLPQRTSDRDSRAARMHKQSAFEATLLQQSLEIENVSAAHMALEPFALDWNPLCGFNAVHATVYAPVIRIGSVP